VLPEARIGHALVAQTLVVLLVAICAGYLLIPVERARITQENRRDRKIE
jgi:hypothetical protein